MGMKDMPRTSLGLKKKGKSLYRKGDTNNCYGGCGEGSPHYGGSKIPASIDVVAEACPKHLLGL